MLPLIAVPGLEELPHSVSGNLSFRFSPTETRAYVSMVLPRDVLINASAPLSLESDALRSSSFTVKGKLGGLSLAAGNLKISDAAGFLARPDLVSSRGESILYSTNLGNSSDPLGIAVASSRLSLFLTGGELYTCGALQYLAIDGAVRLATSLGTLLDSEDQGSLMHCLRPWFAFGVGSCVSNVSFQTRVQLYPDFEAAGGDFFDFAWLKAAACRLDISWSSPRQKIKGFLYVEAGDFVSATGKVASRDALAQIDYVADIVWIPFAEDLSFGLSVFSKQGAADTVVVETPSFGAFPDSLALKYWPDGAKGRLRIDNKELRAALFHATILLDSSFSVEVIKKPDTWSGKFGFDLNIRSPSYTAAPSASPKLAASQARESHPRAPELGVELTLQSSRQVQEEVSKADEDFGDISEYEAAEDVSATAQGASGALMLDRAMGALSVDFGEYSGRMAIEFPLKPSDSDAFLITLRTSAKMNHFLVEASGTGNYKAAEKRFAIASAYLYVKIPL